jgi:hypothetical protein
VTGLRRGDLVTAADGNPRKARGTVQQILELTEQDWADRSFCWVSEQDCMRRGQVCLRTRPDGAGTWVYVMWSGLAGPYAERLSDLVEIPRPAA